jgi:hypothetical protein
MNYKRIFSLATATAIALSITSIAQAAGNDFFNGTLRFDQSEVALAGDYYVNIAQVENPTTVYLSPHDFTTAWLGIYLDHQPGLFGMKFSQVGIQVRQNGLQWFVYAESGINWCRGTTHGSMECRGNVGDIVQTYHFAAFQLRRVWMGFYYN